MIAEVIVDIAHSEVDKIFEYRAGENVPGGQPRQGSLFAAASRTDT